MGVARYLTLQQHAAEYAQPPSVDDRDPVEVLSRAVATVLDTAETWLAWDGRPIYRDGNVWTPHKSLRRAADHLLDHLAELECRLAGLPSVDSHWHGRMVTMDADVARFTEIELDEATSRITRLEACYRSLLSRMDSQTLDARPTDQVWTPREVIHHVAELGFYAEVIGDLSPGR